MSTKPSYINKKYLIYLLVIALLLYVVLPQLATFKKSITLLEDVNLPWLLVAAAVSLSAHVISGFKYVSVALKPIRVFPTVMVQLASLLINRLVPAGIGGIGINYMYLNKCKHSKVESAVVVSMNNIAGLIGHMALLVLVLLVSPSISLHLNLSLSTVFIAFLLVILACAGIYVLRQRFTNTFTKLISSLHNYRRHPTKVLWAVVWSLAIAASYSACLYYSAKALGVHLTFLQALIVMSLGVAVTSISPTPGGLIGVEAALVAGLLVYKVTPSQSLAVALLYRLITYWFAMLIGVFAFVICRKSGYF